MRGQPAEVGDENATVGAVEQAQSNALARSGDEKRRGLAVDRDDVAPAAIVGQIVRGVELGKDGVLGCEQPIVQHPGDFARPRQGRGILDDQDPVEASFDLLARADVRVVPEGAGVFRGELVGERLAGLDGRPRGGRYPVHVVGHADAVPMNGGRLR